MRVITLNSSNLVPRSTNNLYRFNFPTSKRFEKGDYIALKRIGIFNSIFAIKPEYNNNTYSYIFPSGAGFVNRTVVIPDGTYTVAQLNAQLQSRMIANNDYLIDDQGNFVYFIEWVENPVRYAVQLNVAPVPAVLPALWSNPGIALPPVNRTPSVGIPNTNLTKIFGFNAGSYPSVPQGTPYSKISDFTPQLSPIYGCVVGCSLVNNSNVANLSQTLSSFAINVKFGDLIDVDVQRLVFTDITPGIYNSFDIFFLDDAFNPLQIVDTNLIIQVVIWRKDEDGSVAQNYYISNKSIR